MSQIVQLKPQDILVALKLHLERARSRPRLVDIASDLGLSQAEVSGSIKRSIFAGLSRPEDGVPYPEALKEFILHGLRYAFPAKLGAIAKGMPTSHSAPPLNKKISSAEHYVWPHGEGETRGSSVEPLYPSVPFAASRDPKLYELFALIDALRVGQARDKKIASQELEKRLSA
jgi:hypothetical protein